MYTLYIDENNKCESIKMVVTRFWVPSQTTNLSFTIRPLFCLETEGKVKLLHIYYLTVIAKSKELMRTSFNAKQTSLNCFSLIRLWEARTFPTRWKMGVLSPQVTIREFLLGNFRETYRRSAILIHIGQ